MNTPGSEMRGGYVLARGWDVAASSRRHRMGAGAIWGEHDMHGIAELTPVTE
jgi:hypothetical protein